MARGRARGSRRRRSKEDAAKAIEEEDEAIVEKEEQQPPSTDDDDDDCGSDQSLDRRSRLPSSPPPSALRSPPPRTTDSTSNNNNNSNNKIYMLLSFQKSNPVSQALYAVDASPPPTLQPHSYGGGGELTQSSEKIIYPVFEFMKQDGFPDCMSCVVLGSSIYFLGGDYDGELPVGFPFTFFSEKVYRIDDAANIPLTPTDPRSVLHEVAPMSSGKPMCYCFVALGLLFAIGVQDWRPPQTVFEVYDPGMDKWTPLPDPPFPDSVVSDVVVGNMVILKTAGGRVYSFDAASRQWENLAQRRGSTATCYMGACGRGIFLDDTIFWDHSYDVISSGPTSRVDPGDKVKDFMSILYTSASAELGDAIDTYQAHNSPSTWLQYLGNRIFAYVVCGNFPDPQNPDDRDCPGHPEKSKASILVFEIPKEEEGGGGGGHDTGFEQGWRQRSPFKVNLLHVAKFECRSNKGANHTGIFLQECFSNSS